MKKSSFTLLFAVLVFAVLQLAACSQAELTGWTALYDSDFLAVETEQALGMGAPSAAAPMPPAPPQQAGTWAADMGMDDMTGNHQVDWEDIAQTGERHVIQAAMVELESDYFYDVVDALRQIAPDLGGYISSEMLTRQRQGMFMIVLRVPAREFDSALSKVQDLGNVRRLNSEAEDVTDSFYDLAGNLETRRIEEERLLALIEEAVSITDILALETRLSDTRLVIERYESRLNMMAGQIAYSTIHVQLRDTAEETAVLVGPSIGERIGGAFGESVDGTINMLQNIIVFIAGVIIPLTFLCLLGFAAFAVVRLVRKKIKT